MISHSRLIAIAESWRVAAMQLRNQNRTATGVPPNVEAAAMTMEACAGRIEREINDLSACADNASRSDLTDSKATGGTAGGDLNR